MTTHEIVASILSQFEGATLVRKSKQTFVAIPMGENEDGVMEYAKVAVGTLLSKDTKSNTAFNFEAAVLEQQAHEAEVAERAAKPKAPKKSGADPEKQAAAAHRQELILAWLIQNPGEHTATEVKAGVDELANITIMQVGSDLKALGAAGSIANHPKDGKNYWAFNA